MKKVLTIAGSDCSGGAGIQADLKTMTAHNVYGMSVITALTAQNTMGVEGIFEIEPKFVAGQMDSVFTDITPDAIKIGMVSNKEIIDAIVEKLGKYRAKNIVVDPVMISTSGSRLMSEQAMDAIITRLIPCADIITPNILEAQALCGIEIKDKADMEQGAREIARFFKGAVLIKGGHLKQTADDLLLINGQLIWIEGGRVENPNTHGTGCTLSSSIACNLALGHDILQSVKLAKKYITGAISWGLDLGKGSGPLNHMWDL